LTQQQRNTLRALGAWRELKARSRNLPRGFILSDDALVSLIKRPPEKLEDIRQMKGLSERSADRNRKYIWEALERGRSGDLPDLPNNKHNGPSPDDGYEARVDLSLASIKGICLADMIDPALIGNRAEVTAFVLEVDDLEDSRHRMMRGWRLEFCGQALARLLKGEGSISIDVETKLPRLG
jgi:ribonuclease D